MAVSFDAIFVETVSPGQVFRYLERRERAGDIVTAEWFLTEPVAPHGWRVLYATERNGISFTYWGQAFSAAFQNKVLLLSSSEQSWGYHIWNAGEFVDGKRQPLPVLSPFARFLERLPGARVPLSPPVVWAKAQGLPIHRVPGMARSRDLPAPVDYRTVVGLDQKSLLLEDTPKCYRYRPGEPL